MEEQIAYPSKLDNKICVCVSSCTNNNVYPSKSTHFTSTTRAPVHPRAKYNVKLILPFNFDGFSMAATVIPNNETIHTKANKYLEYSGLSGNKITKNGVSIILICKYDIHRMIFVVNNLKKKKKLITLRKRQLNEQTSHNVNLQDPAMSR